MKEETKVTIRNYAICFVVEALIAFLVIWSKGFFTESASVNLQIWSDAFFVAGILMVLYAGFVYVSGEGALIGMKFFLRNIFLAFIPMGRAKYERYGDYRERMLAEGQKRQKSHILITGLVFLSVGIILTVIWYKKYYNLPL